MGKPAEGKMFRAVANAWIRLFIRFGHSGHPMYLMTVKDHETGQSYSTHIEVTEKDGQRWFVVPFTGSVDWRGNIQRVDWVGTLRATGQITLTQGRRKGLVTIVEAQPEESREVLKAYFTGRFSPLDDLDGTPPSQEEPIIPPFLERNGVPLVPVFRLVQETPS